MFFFMVMDGCGWFGLPTSESSLGVESALSLVQILEENHRLTPELQFLLGVVIYIYMFYVLHVSKITWYSQVQPNFRHL
jgi:hypothetical protein